jgi:DNA uptake protein ComE-like DNA-binding protein
MRLIKKYFGFFYTEFKGALILCTCALFFALLPRFFLAQSNSKKINFGLPENKVNELIAQQIESEKYPNWSRKKYNKPYYNKFKRALNNNYKFKSWEQASKYTGLSVQELKNNPETEKMLYPKKYTGVIDLNNSDTTQFMGLISLGSSVAKRIVNYRDRLGGFYKKEQLLEVFYLDTQTIKEQWYRITLNPLDIKKIDIQTASEEELAAHPYIYKYDAPKIIAFRLQHPQLTLASFMQIKSITDDRKLRMIPYLKF